MKLPLLAALLLGPVLACRADAPDKDGLAAFPRLRGFTTSCKADDGTLGDLAATGANSLRLILSPVTSAAGNPAKGWQDMLAKLPAQLDAAKARHLFVIVSLFTPPIPAPVPTDPEGRKAWGHQFWNDPASLDLMTRQAVETARLIRPYEGMVWLELKNEPLDWADYPAIPHNWPDWSQKIVDAVRAVSRVPIVIQVGPGGLCGGFATFQPLRGDNLVYSLHNYQPHEYTHQGVKQLIGTDLAHPYELSGKGWPGPFADKEGGLWNKDRLRKELEPARQFQLKYQARIYVGEFGVARWAPGAAAYLRDNLELFEEYGWDWSSHAFRESHIWSPEYDSTYSDFKNARLADGETDRMKVLKEFLHLNATAR